MSQPGALPVLQVSRSVPAGDLHELLNGLQKGYVVPEALMEMLGRCTDIEAYVNRRTLL